MVWWAPEGRALRKPAAVVWRWTSLQSTLGSPLPPFLHAVTWKCFSPPQHTWFAWHRKAENPPDGKVGGIWSYLHHWNGGKKRKKVQSSTIAIFTAILFLHHFQTRLENEKRLLKPITAKIEAINTDLVATPTITAQVSKWGAMLSKSLKQHLQK